MENDKEKSYSVLIPLADGFEDIEGIATIDILRRGGITVTTAGVNKEIIETSHGVKIHTDCLYDTISTDAVMSFDGIVLPGGPAVLQLVNNEKLLKEIHINFEEGNLCAAICAAPRILHEAKILKGKKFCCYPGVEKAITSGIFSTETVVCDGSVITSRGAGTAIPFALAILEYFFDKEISLEIKKQIIA